MAVSKQVRWTIGDGLRAEAVLESMLGGRVLWTQADAFRGIVAMMARAERTFLLAAPGGPVPADAMLLTIGGRPKEEIDSVPDEVADGYRATQRALQSLFYTARKVHPTTPTIDIPVDVPAVAPVVVALTVLGVTAIAATAWFGAEAIANKIELEKHQVTTLAQVDLYLKDLNARIAAGQPLPEPPSPIIRSAEVEKNSGVIILGTGLLLGGAAVAGAVVAMRRRAIPVASNPGRRAGRALVRRRRARRLAPSSLRAAPRRRPLERRARSRRRPSGLALAIPPTKRNPKRKRKVNPKPKRRDPGRTAPIRIRRKVNPRKRKKIIRPHKRASKKCTVCGKSHSARQHWSHKYAAKKGPRGGAYRRKRKTKKSAAPRRKRPVKNVSKRAQAPRKRARRKR